MSEGVQDDSKQGVAAHIVVCEGIDRLSASLYTFL